jgi:hypothetical protein
MPALTPIALLVDDSCPLLHVYRNHWVDVHKHFPETDDGRPLLEHIPNTFLDRFCDVVERHRMAGSFLSSPPQLVWGMLSAVSRASTPLRRARGLTLYVPV